jgi:hypothetical protein
MANALYPKWKEQILQGTAAALLNGSGTTGVYAALVTSTYAYGAAHEFYDAGGASDVVDALCGATAPVEIGATKSYTNGVFDGGDVTFTAVPSGAGNAIVIFIKNAGAQTTWRLVAYLDTNVTGLPVTGNGGNITVTWNASGILAL